MGKSYKRWEETGIYADTYELVKSVHSVIYDFPKKDRVVIGDKMIDKATSMIFGSMKRNSTASTTARGLWC